LGGLGSFGFLSLAGQRPLDGRVRAHARVHFATPKTSTSTRHHATKISALAQKILKHPQTVNIAISKPANGVLQQVYLAYDHQKVKLIHHILQDGSYSTVIIFASRKETVKALNQTLKRAGIRSEAFHSDLEQEQRETILRSFRNKHLPVLVGTDVISRGIDVEGISLVINYDAPPDPEDYVHRIGRTARAETTGTAITFINEHDQRKFHAIETLIGMEVTRIPLPEGLGEPPIYQPFIKQQKPKKSSHRKKIWKKK
jgi:superfamily II DNA/RNA helicase